MEIDEVTYRREQAATKAIIESLVVPEQSEMLTAGEFLETLADAWIEATESERKDLLGLLLEAVIVDVMSRRVVCVQPHAAYVTLFRRVESLWERDGFFHLAESRRA